MTHKLILKVKKFQLFSAKYFGIVKENLKGMDSPDSPTPKPFRVEMEVHIAFQTGGLRGPISNIQYILYVALF